MGRASYNKIGGVKQTKKVTRKLHITEYGFVYNKEDLNNGELEYYFDEIMSIEYEDGKRKGETYSPILCFSISAEDSLFNTFTFSFELNMDLGELNKLANKPNDINKYVIEGETFLNNPYENHCGGPMFLVSKIEENKFIFKVCIPEETFFCWFKVDFNENGE